MSSVSTIKSQRHVVMVGTALEGRGGMSSVAANYRAQGLFERTNVAYIETHREISAAGKLWLVISGLSRLFGLLLSDKVSLIHIHAASGVSFWRKSLFALLGKAFCRPVIIHIHGGEFLEFYGSSSSAGRWFIRWTLEGARRVIVLSKTWKKKIASISPRLHVEILANPVVLPSCNLSPANDGLHFLFLGRLERDKGVFELLEAFAFLVKSFPEARLTLAGEGEREAVLHRILALDIEQQVDLPGWVAGKEKEELLAAANIFVLPSYIEGLPVSMLEAMAYGMPVVVSSVGSVPEVLIDAENGLMVEAGNIDSLQDALLRIASSATLRRKLGVSGKNLVINEFAVDMVCSKLELIYRNINEQAGAS